MTSVLVADDQALVRAGICGIVGSDPGLTVAGEAGTGLEAVRLVEATKPDVVLMDIRMPEMDGIEATRHIVAAGAGSSTRVLILTTFDLDEYVFGALRAGASGFLLKDAPPTELLHAVHVIAGGDALLAPTVTRTLVDEFTRRMPEPVTAPRDAVLEGITDREREVLALVAEGLSNAEIATRLYISPATAKTHVAHLLAKLEARDRVQLVIVAFQSGLVPR